MNFTAGRWMAVAGVAAWLVLFAGSAYAQAPATDRKAEADAAFKAAQAVMTKGPADIKLADQAVIKIPGGQTFIPAAEAGRLLRVTGNRPGDDMLGMVMPLGEAEWFVVARNVKAGYIKDDDAKDWKADELLSSIKEGTDEMNKERRTRGMGEIDIIGWVQPPTYDPSTHRLLWSLSSKEKGAKDASDAGINFCAAMTRRCDPLKCSSSAIRMAARRSWTARNRWGLICHSKCWYGKRRMAASCSATTTLRG